MNLILLFLQYSIFILKTAHRILLQSPLCNTTDGSLSQNLLVNMVFKFPMYAVHDLKAKILGNSLTFPFSYRCNNKRVHLYYPLLVLLEA